MENTPSWAYTGTGICSVCDRPSFLYTNSFAIRYREYDGYGNLIMCHSCHLTSLRMCRTEFHHRGDLPESQREAYLLETRLLLTADLNNFAIPERDSEQLCSVCESPGVEDKQLVSMEHPVEGTIIVQAHVGCSTQVSCCSRRIPFHYDNLNGGTDSTQLLNIDGDHYCPQCLNNHLRETDTTLHDYRQCGYCSNYSHQGNCRSMQGSYYCNYCYDNYRYHCEDCSSYYWDGDDHYCSDEDDSGVIHSYGYKPAPYFFGKKSGERLFFGFELEVEVTSGDLDDSATLVQDTLGARVYLKHDGSLNHGFEIVTHPHTLEAYKKEFSWDSFQRFRKAGLRSWNTSTCGLHVHVSRDAFGIPYDSRTDNFSEYIRNRQNHELRFIKLIYDNQRQVCRLAGRQSDFANFTDKGNLISKIKTNSTDGGRYSAVNTENESTLEVRIFKGSLKPERVLSALEFVHAGVEYTRNLKVNGKNKALSWLAFSSFVHGNMETYPYLHDAMVATLNNEMAVE